MVADSKEGDTNVSTAEGRRYKQNDVSNFIDSHIQEIKYTLYGIGALSVVYILRGIYATRVIVTAADVPKVFITEGIKLQGHVKAVGSKGVLYVQHIPALNLVPARWRDSSTEKAAPLSVAMVDMTPYGSKWLQENLDMKHVWFRILAVNDDEPMPAEIFLKKKWKLREISVNQELVNLGLCKIDYPSESDLKSLTTYQNELLQRLMKTQKDAVNKNKGLWKPSEERSSGKSKVGRFVGSVLKTTGKILIFPINFVRKKWK